MNQKKAKFNIVDVIVLLILIVGVALVAIKMFGDQLPVSDPSGDSYLITYRADCVPEEFTAGLSVGSHVAENERNLDLGSLVDFSIDQSVTYGYDSKGNCVASEMPGHVSVTLVCQVNGIQQPTGLKLGKYLLNVGHELGLCAGNTELQAVVWSIVPLAAE